MQKYQHGFFDALFSGLSCVVSVPFYTAFLPLLFWVSIFLFLFIVNFVFLWLLVVVDCDFGVKFVYMSIVIELLLGETAEWTWQIG